jgi:pimeloyl-ACP methyl ester carboxylesterase
MQTIRSADGTRIAFEKIGEGLPVILVGGAFCDHTARVAGTALAAQLRATHTVVCFDRRGRGESADTPPYAVMREVEDVAALISAVGASAYVYGHSSGAMLALETALAGHAIRKLALYEPPLVLTDERPPMPPDLEKELIRLLQAGQRSEAVEVFLTRGVAMPGAMVAGMKNASAWRSLVALAHTLPYDVRLTSDAHGLVARARHLTTPTTILHGEGSPAWMRSGVAELARAIPGARSVALSRQIHNVDPEVLAPELRALFAD